MNPRELIILLLGFVMVAVLLRGLFVAIQVRKGQIRLTIDKNIPQDFDLEELELAELPTGGARVVCRADAPQEPQIGDPFGKLLEPPSEHGELIPILMDVVELEDSGINSDEPDAKYNERDAIRAGFYEDIADSGAPFVPTKESDISSKESECDSNLTHPAAEGIQSGGVGHQEFDEVAREQSVWDASDDNKPNGTSYANANDLPEDLDSVSLIKKTSHKSEISDYPENEWYEDDEFYARSDSFHEENVAESLETDYTTEPVASSESSNPAIIGGDKPNEFAELDERYGFSDKTSLGSLESENLSEFENFDNFSMTAGERIGFDEIQTHSDPEASAPSDEQHLSNKNQTLRGGLNRLFSVFNSKPNEEFVEETPISDGKEPTERSDLIEELEDFIGQSENDMSFKDNEYEFASTQDEPENSEKQVSNLDNVTSIERAVASTWRSNGSETEKWENNPKILSESIEPDPSQILVISAMSSSGRVFEGGHLVQAIERAGFQYGEMGIFHLYDVIEGEPNLVCSAANALNPGTFDLDQLGEFSTIGVSFFLALPTSINNLQAFERMLNAAQQIVSDLDGELKDDQRNVLTFQTIEHYRQRIRDFELDQLRVAGGRG